MTNDIAHYDAKRHLLVCDCGDCEHQIIFTIHEYGDPPYTPDTEMVLTYHLTSLSFWERIKRAFFYIFGRKSKYGDFGEVVISKNAANKLVDFMKEYTK